MTNRSGKRTSDARRGNLKDRGKKFGTRIPELGYYLIITNTEETEKNYFEGLRDSIPKEMRNRLVIKVEKAKTEESIKCCDNFAKEFKKVTNQTYRKEDEKLYLKIKKSGDEDRAIKIAEARYNQYANDGKSKPSSMISACTLQLLIKEINHRIQK